MQCLKLLGSYNILSACIVGLSECACAARVWQERGATPLTTQNTGTTPGQLVCASARYMPCVAYLYHVSCAWCRPAGRPRTSTDGWHQATVTISRCCRGLCRDIAIKKKSTIRALVCIISKRLYHILQTFEQFISTVLASRCKVKIDTQKNLLINTILSDA